MLDQPMTQATSQSTPAAIRDLVSAVSRVYRGSQQAVDLMVIAYLARGHVLIEDIPGVGRSL